MTHQEILEKAMQKAIDNGADLKLTPLSIPQYAELCLKSPWLEQLLFGSHEFAKALWGENPHDLFVIGKTGDGKYTTVNHPMPSWAYHLQHMVTATDPIEYLGENM